MRKASVDRFDLVADRYADRKQKLPAIVFAFGIFRIFLIAVCSCMAGGRFYLSLVKLHIR